MKGAGGVQDCFFSSERRRATSVQRRAAAHRALVEQVVEVDAAFVDRYLNDGDVPARASCTSRWNRRCARGIWCRCSSWRPRAAWA